MSRKKSIFKKAFAALAALGLIVIGVGALTTDATARSPRPEPQCGPTILYECTFRGGDTELVGLTVCEVAKFEKKNKATCERASF